MVLPSYRHKRSLRLWDILINFGVSFVVKIIKIHHIISFWMLLWGFHQYYFLWFYKFLWPHELENNSGYRIVNVVFQNPDWENKVRLITKSLAQTLYKIYLIKKTLYKILVSSNCFFWTFELVAIIFHGLKVGLCVCQVPGYQSYSSTVIYVLHHDNLSTHLENTFCFLYKILDIFKSILSWMLKFRFWIERSNPTEIISWL